MANDNDDKSPADKAEGKGGKGAAAGYIWILNNEERARSFQLRGRTSEVSRVLAPGPTFHLGPGWNLVELRLWQRWKDENKGVGEERGQADVLLNEPIPFFEAPARRRERAGRPYLEEGPLVKDRNAPFADLADNRVRAMVADLNQPELLAVLLKRETRSTVAEALRQQIQRFERADNFRESVV